MLYLGSLVLALVLVGAVDVGGGSLGKVVGKGRILWSGRVWLSFLMLLP